MDYAERTADVGQAANPVGARTVDDLHEQCISPRIGTADTVDTPVAPGGVHTCSGPGRPCRL
eukprot:6981343-Lingulodinium_polyedra.AAC.1